MTQEQYQLAIIAVALRQHADEPQAEAAPMPTALDAWLGAPEGGCEMLVIDTDVVFRPGDDIARRVCGQPADPNVRVEIGAYTFRACALCGHSLASTSRDDVRVVFAQPCTIR